MKQRVLTFLPHALILLVAELLFLPSLADLLRFLLWWLCFAAMGIAFLPVTSLAFGKFKNGGYMFSKTICLALASYLQWLLSSLHILPFRVWSCFLILLLLVAVNYLVNRKTGTWQRYMCDDALFKSTANQEALFMALLLIWAYLRVLKPDLEGLEKFMDFGFMNSILRSDWLPAPDMWLSGAGINYYYLGHFVAAFLTRITFINSAVSYNLMMATLFALSFMLAYTVAEFLIEIYQKNSTKQEFHPNSKRAGVIAGVFAGLAVCVAGNLHSLIFAVLFPKKNISETYWFPDATRYIGYNPDILDDKTIHEFPLYSFVVSDLHAHVINIIFVLTVVGLVISLAVDLLKGCGSSIRDQKSGAGDQKSGVPESAVSEQPDKGAVGMSQRAGASVHAVREQPSKMAPEKSSALIPRLMDFLKHPSVLLVFTLIILLIGLFPAINFWDYPIYVVFTGAILLYANLRTYNYSLKSLLMTAGQVVVVAVGAYIVTLPFQFSFESMGTQIHLVEQRSKLYQLGILWGCPFFFAVALTYIMIRRYKQQGAFGSKAKKNPKGKGIGGKHTPDSTISDLYIPPTGNQVNFPLFRFMEKVNPADALVFIIFICAVGLVIIPELIYVADIYPSHPRANTMFKLGYQAFILFGLGIGYTFIRMIFLPKKLLKQKTLLAAVGGFLLAATLIYPYFAMDQWYVKHFPSTYEGLDGTTYMLDHEMPYTDADGETYMLTLSDDYLLIQYINKNIKGSPVIAEANGGAYTLNGRISSYTGLPNILNWYTHQELWRNSNYDMLDERSYDINNLYEFGDPARVREIIRKYDVKYIVVGQIERLRYPWMDEGMLQTMGEIVFRSNDLYLISVD